MYCDDVIILAEPILGVTALAHILIPNCGLGSKLWVNFRESESVPGTRYRVSGINRSPQSPAVHRGRTRRFGRSTTRRPNPASFLIFAQGWISAKKQAAPSTPPWGTRTATVWEMSSNGPQGDYGSRSGPSRSGTSRSCCGPPLGVAGSLGQLRVGMGSSS